MKKIQLVSKDGQTISSTDVVGWSKKELWINRDGNLERIQLDKDSVWKKAIEDLKVCTPDALKVKSYLGQDRFTTPMYLNVDYISFAWHTAGNDTKIFFKSEKFKDVGPWDPIRLSVKGNDRELEEQLGQIRQKQAREHFASLTKKEQIDYLMKEIVGYQIQPPINPYMGNVEVDVRLGFVRDACEFVNYTFDPNAAHNIAKLILVDPTTINKELSKGSYEAAELLTLAMADPESSDAIRYATEEAWSNWMAVTNPQVMNFAMRLRDAEYVQPCDIEVQYERGEFNFQLGDRQVRFNEKELKELNGMSLSEFDKRMSKVFERDEREKIEIE